MIPTIFICVISTDNDLSAVFSTPDASAAHDYAKQVSAELDDPERKVLVISCPAPAATPAAAPTPTPATPAAPVWTPAPDCIYEDELEQLRDDEYIFLDLVTGRHSRLVSSTSVAKDTYERELALGADSRTISRFPVRGFAHGGVIYSVTATAADGYPWSCPWDGFDGGYIYAPNIKEAERAINLLNAINNGGLMVLRTEDGDIEEVAIYDEVPRD
jgi:hypothetical protein